MDIRITNFANVRVLLKPPASRLASKFATHVENAAQRALASFRPAAVRCFGLRRRFATAAVAVLAAWLFVHVTFGANGMMIYRTKRAEVQDLQREIHSLSMENDRYEKQIDDLKTDPKTIEKEAREQLHYARPGEVVYVIPPPPENEDRPRTNAAQK